MSTMTHRDHLRALDGIRESLSGLFRVRKDAKEAEKQSKEISAKTLPKMLEVDGPNGKGILFDVDGEEHCAVVCVPDAGEVWDVAKLTEHLKTKRAGVWRKVSVTRLDPHLLAATIASGGIDEAELDAFKLPGEDKTPYIKFVNPNPESK